MSGDAVCWADSPPSRRWAVWAMHIAAIAALLAVEGPFGAAYVRFLRWVSDSETRQIMMVDGKSGLAVVLNTTREGVVVESRTVEPAPGARLRVSVVSELERTVTKEFLKKLVKGEYYNFFQQIGVIYTGIFVSLFLWIHDRPRRKYVLVFIAAMIVAVIFVWFMQHTVGKLRIKEGNPALVYLPFPRGWLQAAGLAFPSGHTTFAFVLATLLAWAYPRAKWLFYAVAAGCGISRIVTVQHWLSDVYAGALLGYAVTLLTIRLFLDHEERIMSWLPARLRAALRAEP